MLRGCELQPHAPAPVPLLLVDGDGLAYYCAGPDGSPLSKAQAWVQDMLRTWQGICQPARTLILMTAAESNKGGRYAIATVKPYQGQRRSARRPDNWAHLREYLEAGRAGEVSVSTRAEADDLFAYHAARGRVAIASQDKDMRMLHGLHLTWDGTRAFEVHGDVVHDEKQYGHQWFWQQVLSGDTADNIPGLPLLYGKKCGDKGAAKFIATCPPDNAGRLEKVRAAYRTLYQGDGDDRLLEQAALLWLRTVPVDPLDVCRPGNPLETFDNDGAKQRLLERTQ